MFKLDLKSTVGDMSDLVPDKEEHASYKKRTGDDMNPIRQTKK